MMRSMIRVSLSKTSFNGRPATAPVSGTVYKITGSTMTVSGKNGTLNGNGAILLVSGGLVIDGCEGLTISNLVISGPLVIRNSSGVIFENCQILAAGKTAVTVESSANNVLLNACRLIGGTAVVNAADEFTLMNSYHGFAEENMRFNPHILDLLPAEDLFDIDPEQLVLFILQPEPQRPDLPGCRAHGYHIHRIYFLLHDLTAFLFIL